MVKYFLILSLYLSGSYLYAQTITVSSFTDTSDYLVGDFINFNIEVVTNKSVQVLDPVFPDTLSKLDLISKSEPVRNETDKSNTIKYNFILAGYDSVFATIPPVTIAYRSEGDT